MESPRTIYNWGIKLLLVGLSGFALYQQLFTRPDLEELWQTFLNSFSIEAFIYLGWAIVLIPINWGLETLKWYYLVKPFSGIRFFQAYKGILTGVSLSLFTPSRLGDYGGRMLVLEAQYKLEGAIATFICGLAQLMIVWGVGVVGILYFSLHIAGWVDAYPRWWFVLAVLGALLLFSGFLFFSKWAPLIKYLPLGKRILKILLRLEVLSNYEPRVLFWILGGAFFRYLTYSLQYFLILKFYSIEVSLFSAWAGIATIFLVQTSIPLPPVLGLIARGDIALFVWGYFETNEISILAATFTLFILNIGLPSLLGMALLVRINVLKSLGYENKAS